MRLKKIEIKGFKSFANETILNFGQDVIGIVGPNGSGKSNIVDAIRWVLGEQSSRELRLDQMASVLFNGAKKKKPAGLAQVSLTLENTKNVIPSEYNQLTISRLLYRTGESEYRLNNVPCRLKDITSLFLDTGIGPDSYAIIALGMVDEILSDKDNSRRRMFEQAAGISKYKLRKRETLNKLKSTSADLERIEDLLFEIETNLKSLEKQAKRTKRFFDIKEKYKIWSIELISRKVKVLNGQLAELKEQLEKEQVNFRKLEVENARLEAALEAERTTNLKQEKELSEKQKVLNHLIGEIREQENEKRILEQRQEFIHSNRKKMEAEVEVSQKRVASLQKSVDGFAISLKNEKEVEAELELNLKQANTLLNGVRGKHKALKSSLDGILSRQRTIEKEVVELEKRKAVNANQLESFSRQLKSNKENIEAKRFEISKLETTLAELEREESKSKKALVKLEVNEAKRQAEMHSKQEEMAKLEREIAKINRKIDARRNELQLTQNMIENLEGFPESIRFLRQNKEWSKDAPLLSDLIYVEEEYRVAIENYLDQYLNYYVVENIGEAQKAVIILSESQKGKANFFLRDAFEGYDPPIILLPNTLRAIDLIEAEPAYRKLFNYLLENVLIIENEDIRRDDFPAHVAVVSKSGRIIRKRFSVSGGSIGLFEGKKIGRKKNLEALEKVIKQLEKKEQKLSQNYYQLLSEIEVLKKGTLKLNIESARNHLNSIIQERISQAMKLENFENFVKDFDARSIDTSSKMETLKKENVAIEIRLKEEISQASAAKSSLSDLDISVRSAAEELSAATSGYNEKNIEYIRQQNKVIALEQQLGFHEKQLKELFELINKDKRALENFKIELDQTGEKITKTESWLLHGYEKKKTGETKLSEAETLYFKLRGKVNEIEDDLRKLSKKQQDTQMIINNLKDKRTDLKFQMSSMVQRLKIEFNIEIKEVIHRESEVNLEDEDLQMKVERLRNRIDNYGDVNPLAIQAYDAMKERHDTITEQREDIVKAKESLIETIKEIEDTATSQFLMAFDKTRLYFIDVFRSLFTENDNCDLILLDPENPLESKIEIIAKPKGKRPQTINQLSGGEKTLTAIALLFALYLLKPAPFCIFDEVDAPLDDANIEKFNKIIKKFSKDSQFIIVTHNKLTMAAVDTIYGVYMQEHGVSGVSQVDFRNFKHSSTLQTSV